MLNRAEWVKFVAVFFNKEVEANKLFNDIVTNYQQLNASARAAAAGAANPTRVAWTNKFGDTLTLSYAVYKKEYMTVRALLVGKGVGAMALNCVARLAVRQSRPDGEGVLLFHPKCHSLLSWCLLACRTLAARCLLLLTSSLLAELPRPQGPTQTTTSTRLCQHSVQASSASCRM